MNAAETEGFRREALRIQFRQALMSVPGGVEWLVHVGKLFKFREQLLGPGDFGVPTSIRVMLYQLGW